jgi:hypothetical protein
MGGNYYQDFTAQKSVKVTEVAIPLLPIAGLVIAIIAIATVLLLKKLGKI